MFGFAELLLRVQQAAEADVLLFNLYSQQQFFTSTVLTGRFTRSCDRAPKIQEITWKMLKLTSGLHRKPAQRMADSSPFPLIAKCLIKSKLGNENCLADQSGTAVLPAQHCLSDINLIGNVVFGVIVSKSDWKVDWKNTWCILCVLWGW